jgi:hypothetical protein
MQQGLQKHTAAVILHQDHPLAISHRPNQMQHQPVLGIAVTYPTKCTFTCHLVLDTYPGPTRCVSASHATSVGAADRIAWRGVGWGNGWGDCSITVAECSMDACKGTYYGEHLYTSRGRIQLTSLSIFKDYSMSNCIVISTQGSYSELLFSE